jgi:RNA polymerase sigma-70 factor, ECF subfamily
MEINPHVRAFEKHRDQLNAVAYRMLGCVSDCEDVVQEAYIRWSGIRLNSVDSEPAFLTSIVSRLCIDRLRRRKVEKLNYIGPWLPDPVPTLSGPEDDLETVESLNMAFMVLMEKLNPLERAVLVLKEAFDFSHMEIAEMLHINVSHSRQLLRRARSSATKLDEVNPAGQGIESIVATFISAAHSGEIEAMQTLLCDDVVAYTDGGGRVAAALIPLIGQEKVTTVFSHLISRNFPNFEYSWLPTNGQSGLLIYEAGKLASVTTFSLRHGKIAEMYVMRNPDKLKAFSGVRIEDDWIKQPE